jgi:hypothetical protein
VTKGKNIKVPGHAMRRPNPDNPYRAECYCGAWARVIPERGKTAPQLRKDWHDSHKIEVLRKQGKLEED